jgi:hypothetical protein
MPWGPCFPFERVRGPKVAVLRQPVARLSRAFAARPIHQMRFSSQIEVAFLASEPAASVRAADYANGWNGAYRLNGLSFNKLLPVGSIN